MPKTVAIIQARLGSTRLPRKVLSYIGDLTALEWVVRAAKAASLVDQVVVATPDLEIVGFCTSIIDVDYWMGPEDNVLKRFRDAADMAEADIIVRLTADCPFVDPRIIDKCIETGSCAVDQWPDGMDVQVFKAEWLSPMCDREHVVPLNNSLAQLPCPGGHLRDIRLTLDTAEDLERLRFIAEYLPKNRPPTWHETLSAYMKLHQEAA